MSAGMLEDSSVLETFEPAVISSTVSSFIDQASAKMAVKEKNSRNPWSNS